MEKYINIINLVVPKYSDRTIIIEQLQEIEANPLNYVENNDRIITLDNDYLWLGLVDLLISKDYAFEIDWKDDYGDTRPQIDHLAKQWNIALEDIPELESTFAEEFFPIINKKIVTTNCQLYNLDIDSDSYVTIMTNLNSEFLLMQQDSRIKKY